MTDQPTDQPSEPENRASSSADDFARQAEQAPPGLLAEFWDFVKHEKKWWLTPIILVLLALAAIVVFGSSAAAPFIYPLF